MIEFLWFLTLTCIQFKFGIFRILAFSGPYGALMLAFGTPAYQTVTRKKMFGDEDMLGKDREFGDEDILVTDRE